MYNEFSKVSCDFLCCYIKRFIFSIVELKTECSKIRSLFYVNLFYFLLEINIDKTPKKVKRQKDPKRVEAAHKGREKYVNKLKESILNDVEKGSGDTTNASNEATSANNNASNENASATARSNHTYIYGVGILAVLAIGVCVFFAYNTFSKNKKIINEKQDQPPKRLRVFKKPL